VTVVTSVCVNGFCGGYFLSFLFQVHVLVVIAAFYGGLTLAKNGIVMWKNREIPKAKAYIA